MIERIIAICALLIVLATLTLLWTGPQGTPRIDATPTAAFTRAQPESEAPPPAADPVPAPPVAAPDPVVTTTTRPQPAVEPPTTTTSTTQAPVCPYPAMLALPQPDRLAAWNATRPADRAACPMPWTPPLVGGEPAVPVVADGVIQPGVWKCWNEAGSDFPQGYPTCPPNWGPRPPENPTPVGIPPRLSIR